MDGVGARSFAAMVLGILAFTLPACAAKTPRLTSEQTCLTGAYRLADGRSIDVAPADDGDLRWRMADGRVGRLAAKAQWASTLGWTGRPDGVRVGFGGCGAQARITFQDRGEAPVEGRRLKLEVRDTTFRSGDVQLRGRLVLPEGAARVPVIVEVHGSEKDSAVVYNYRQRLFPAQGVGVFVYDKRGTGASTGKYTQDFATLARDAAAAAAEARRLAGGRLARIGFDGGSQGGWVAPLAATFTPVDFVVVGYGLADTPFAENRDEALQDVRSFGPAVEAKAREAIAASEVVMASNFTRGFDRVARIKARYGKEPWFRSLKGEFTGDVFRYPAFALRLIGPTRNVGTPWTYDPMPVLRRLEAPLLWVLAGDDSSAPVEETRRRVVTLAMEGRPVSVLEFPRTEHGVFEYEEDAKGARLETGLADGYLQAVLDFARFGAIRPPYGDAVVLAPTPEA